jgi:hypothetical protein
MGDKIIVTIEELATAFHEWNKDVEDNPESFKESVNLYNAERQAQTLVEYIKEIQGR